MERVWGPQDGLYIAAYAGPTRDGRHYCSYAKVCWRRPASYWDADECLFKLFGGEGHRTAAGAIACVEREARHQIGLLPSSALALVTLAHRRSRASSVLGPLWTSLHLRLR